MSGNRRIWTKTACGIALLLGVWFALSACSRPDGVPRAPGASPGASPSASPIATPTPTPAPVSFDADQAYLRVLEQCGFGPRPTGSINNRLLGDYLVATLERYGWLVEIQEFTYQDVPGRNIIARQGDGPVVILGAHYDTRPFADHDPPETQAQHILGANDGGSGVAVLVELARVLDTDQVPYEVRLVFFDAEDRGHLDGWPFSVGAQEYAGALDVTPEYVIVVDMVGDQNQILYWEGQSDPELNAQIWALAAELGYEQFFVPEVRWQIIDDHVPFIQQGWRAIDIIDFEYPYWHTTQDTADKVSAESLGRIGHVLEVFLESSTSRNSP